MEWLCHQKCQMLFWHINKSLCKTIIFIRNILYDVGNNFLITNNPTEHLQIISELRIIIFSEIL